MAHDGGNCYFSFWATFYPFTRYLAPKKRKLKKKKKNPLRISFCTSVTKIMIICYTVLEIWCVTNVVVIFDFGLFFAFLPP